MSRRTKKLFRAMIVEGMGALVFLILVATILPGFIDANGTDSQPRDQPVAQLSQQETEIAEDSGLQRIFRQFKEAIALQSDQKEPSQPLPNEQNSERLSEQPDKQVHSATSAQDLFQSRKIVSNALRAGDHSSKRRPSAARVYMTDRFAKE